jgi:hypothetical protein
LWGVIATDQALHFSILAVSFYGWRVEGTSPAWRATEGGPITVLRRRCGSDDGRPARGSGAQPRRALGRLVERSTQNVREMIPRRGDVLIEPGLKARETRACFDHPKNNIPVFPLVRT